MAERKETEEKDPDAKTAPKRIEAGGGGEGGQARPRRIGKKQRNGKWMCWLIQVREQVLESHGKRTKERQPATCLPDIQTTTDSWESLADIIQPILDPTRTAILPTTITITTITHTHHSSTFTPITS